MSIDFTPPPSGRLAAEVLPVRSLHPTAVEAMWQLFVRYYADVERATFEADLFEKTDVILLLDEGDRSLCGFSTVDVYRRTVEGRDFIAVFSGDTVLDERYWGQSALQRCFVRYVITVKLRNPRTPVYWYLISKGYKTYLLLSRNFSTFYPRHDRATPAFEKGIIDQLSIDRFGDAYAGGILQFAKCKGRLKPGVAPIDTGLLERPDIRFFVQTNPGHAKGDELCCVGRVDAGLVLRFAGRRIDKWWTAVTHRMRRLWAGATASS